MPSPTTIREQLIEKLDKLTEEELEDLLDYLNMLSDPDELTDQELVAIDEARREAERGEVVTYEEFERSLNTRE